MSQSIGTFTLAVNKGSIVEFPIPMVEGGNKWMGLMFEDVVSKFGSGMHYINNFGKSGENKFDIKNIKTRSGQVLPELAVNDAVIFGVTVKEQIPGEKYPKKTTVKKAGVVRSVTSDAIVFEEYATPEEALQAGLDASGLRKTAEQNVSELEAYIARMRKSLQEAENKLATMQGASGVGGNDIPF